MEIIKTDLNKEEGIFPQRIGWTTDWVVQINLTAIGNLIKEEGKYFVFLRDERKYEFYNRNDKEVFKISFVNETILIKRCMDNHYIEVTPENENTNVIVKGYYLLEVYSVEFADVSEFYYYNFASAITKIKTWLGSSYKVEDVNKEEDVNKVNISMLFEACEKADMKLVKYDDSCVACVPIFANFIEQSKLDFFSKRGMFPQIYSLNNYPCLLFNEDDIENFNIGTYFK